MHFHLQLSNIMQIGKTLSVLLLDLIFLFLPLQCVTSGSMKEVRSSEDLVDCPKRNSFVL